MRTIDENTVQSYKNHSHTTCCGENFFADCLLKSGEWWYNSVTGNMQSRVFSCGAIEAVEKEMEKWNDGN